MNLITKIRQLFGKENEQAHAPRSFDGLKKSKPVQKRCAKRRAIRRKRAKQSAAPQYCDEQTKQMYFYKDSVPTHTCINSGVFVKPVSARNMKKVRVAEFDGKGNPILLTVRKTTEDLLSRTVAPGDTELKSDIDHRWVWNKHYATELPYALYMLGFNSYGVVNATWIAAHHCEIVKFLAYIDAIAPCFEKDQYGNFARIDWCGVKMANHLLFSAGCYKNKLKPNTDLLELFVQAKQEANDNHIDRVAMEKEFVGAADALKAERNARKPSEEQRNFAMIVYFTLNREGFPVPRPNCATVGSLRRFFATYKKHYDKLQLERKQK